jgi:Mlc titration factor MtfA (ptsG expression regulator)
MLGFRERRRRHLRAKVFPSDWLTVLEHNVPYYETLSASQRLELQGHIQVFLAEKHFEGCGGLEITDEIRVTVAAQACILLLGRKTDYYPKLKSILVYPDAYVAHVTRRQADGTVSEADQGRIGESWGHGAVVLSWNAVLRGAADIHDGRNVVLHEFAHQLDQESGATEGAPLLPRRSMYVAWARVLGREYAALVRRIDAHRPDVLDAYGAVSPAEFFAVATECFFERPTELRASHPELYEQLTLFYKQDPGRPPRS